jgi:hypothetical protein
MADEPKGALPDAPRLPQRAAIYIAPDGNVTFGALFGGLVPVAQAIAANSLNIKEGARRTRPAPIGSTDPDTEPVR